MQGVRRIVEGVACGNEPVLITGERGAGQESIADLIHELSPRRARPLVKINFLALPAALIEGELFGDAGAAAGNARFPQESVFHLAGTGSLFLNEIRAIPIELQDTLAQVVENKWYRSVGGTSTRPVNCRILGAMTGCPEAAFREYALAVSLYGSLSGVTIDIPPLRERREDIMPLAMFFLQRYARNLERQITAFSAEAATRLSQFAWPGNVAELENEVRRAVTRCQTSLVGCDDLFAPANEPCQNEFMNS